jgi:hypothetical protein
MNAMLMTLMDASSRITEDTADYQEESLSTEELQ